jgi:phosphotriesterase-related protein
MRQRGLLNRVLLSHDAGWYHVGEPGGGQYRSHETLFTQFLPALRQSGFREEELDRMLVRNPADAFGIRVRDA